LKPEVEFRRQGAFFLSPFWGHISSANQDIFTKLDAHVENGILQRVEWSMYACLEYPKWLTAAMFS